MVQKHLLNLYLARTAAMLSGARRVATLLLVTLLLTMTAQTAWAAETVVTLSVDNDIDEGTAGHYYVNMASSGTTTLTLSDASITTFKVYDDGGKNNHYAYTGNSFLKITVPIGYVIGIAGTANSENTDNDYWEIYNGHLASDGKLFQGRYNSNPASVNVQTTGYKTAIWFYNGRSSYSNDSRNLELTVTLIPDPTYAQDISRATVSGMESVYNYTGSVISVNYSVYSYIENNLLTKGTHYTETITKDGVVTDFKEEGYYTLTITGKAPYSGSQSFNLRIKNDSPELRQDGGEWFVNMPTSGTYTPTINNNISTFKIYDDGGKGGGFYSGTLGNFTPGADGYLQIHAPSGYQVRLTGYVRTRSTNAYLTVYDGSSTSASTLCENVHGKDTGADTDTYNNVTVDVASSGEDMLLHFDAHLEENSFAAEGLILTVTIFPPNSITVNNATGGTVAATVAGTSASTAKMNDVVTLTATPESGYVLSGISATDGSSNAVDIDWSIWANTATFIMPPSAVTVTPTFTNNLTNLNINMHETGEQTATIPMGVQSFQVNYNHCITSSGSSKLILTAPEGYLLQLSGTATLTGQDQAYFRVYDGDDVVNGPILINSSSSGNYTGVVSTGNVMTIYCWTIFNWEKTWDLDITVNVVTANNYNDVAISNSITNGQVVSDKNMANVNETVTLTATPAEGYVLQSISVTDGAGAISLTPSATDATWGDASYYTANEFTFKMRSSDATVNATFMAKTDFYVNMPKTDQRDFAIPDGTTSFKVYDNSGKNGRYFTNDNGKLLLTAPEGYVMNVSGYVKLYYSSGDQDYLDIYDGNSTSATSLGRFKNTSGNSGSQTNTVSATSSNNQMLLHFVTDNSGYVDVGSGVYLTVTLLKTLELANDADNSTAIAASNNDQPFSVTLTGRTLTTGGNWNTLCLPFSLTASQIASSPLAGATIKELDAANTSLNTATGALTLAFAEATAITAGKPYIVKWTTGDNITNPVFNGVTISSTPAQEVESTDGNVKFVGQYSPFTIDDSNINSILYVASGNKIGYSKSARTLKSFRAHFWVKPNGTTPAASMINVDFGEGEVTGVNEVIGVKEVNDNSYYDLQGRKVTKPTKGLYIVNGKKVIIK